MTPEQLIERIEKLMRDAGGRDITHLVNARSLAAEAWRLPIGDRRYDLIREAQAVMKQGRTD